MNKGRGIEQRADIVIDKSRKELVEYPAAYIPCSVIYSDLTKYTMKSVPWHWHPGIEFFSVKSGAVRYCLETGEYVFQKGEGGFINQSVLHATEIAGDAGCELLTFIFSPGLFTGGEENELYQRIESSLEGIQEIPVIALNQHDPWKKEILACMDEAYDGYCEESAVGELLLMEKMMHIWRLVAQHGVSQRGYAVSEVNVQTQMRLKQMLEFIHEHYTEPIVLEDIAKAAGISARECTRNFQNGIRMSPVAYLIKYRITKAQELLCTSGQSVTEVGLQTGFNNSSYFARMFRRYTGESPKKYQQNHSYVKH